MNRGLTTGEETPAEVASISFMHATEIYMACKTNEFRRLVLSRLVHSPPSLHHFVMQGLPPLWWCWDVASPRPVCGFVRTFD